MADSRDVTEGVSEERHDSILAWIRQNLEDLRVGGGVRVPAGTDTGKGNNNNQEERTAL